jgi:hypothetical protein
VGVSGCGGERMGGLMRRSSQSLRDRDVTVIHIIHTVPSCTHAPMSRANSCSMPAARVDTMNPCIFSLETG